MARKTAKRKATKKTAARAKTSRAKKKVAAPRKKKSTKVKKKVAKKKVAKKKVAKRKTPAARKKKTTVKKTTRKRVKKPAAVSSVAAVQKRLEKRVDKLSSQLDEMRHFVKKELAKDVRNTRKFANAESSLQKDRFEQVLNKIREENQDLRARMSKFIAEHEVLKDVTKGVADTARSLEERVRKIVSSD